MDKKSFIFVLVILVSLVFFIIGRNKNQAELKENGVIVSAKILRVNVGGKASGGFQCLINYNGKRIEMSSPSSLKRAMFDFIGKSFPAMYSSNTSTLEILIAPDDFEKFKIPFPDSLNWVMEYVLEK